MTVRKFKLDSSDTDNELVNLFFSFVSDNKDYEVEFLCCHDILLTTVPTHLATAMCRVVELWLGGGTQLSKRQCDHMFEAISQSTSTDLKLKKLVLSGVRMQNLDAETFASALTNLEDVSIIGNVELTEDHLQAVFRAIRNKPILKLRRLVLHSQPLSHMDDDETMSKALCRVQFVSLRFCQLSTNQLTVMFTDIVRASMLQLDTLVLGEDDVRGVAPSLLASAICRLKRCNLFPMNTLQLEKLCSEIAGCKNLSLTQLSLVFSDLADMREDVLASAINRLEAVDLDDSCTGDQLNSILNQSVKCSESKLKELYFQPDSGVDKQLLKKVREKVKVYIGEVLHFI